jgi:hypothetical protein
MKRDGLTVWSVLVVLVVAVVAGGLGARAAGAQDDDVVFLPLVANAGTGPGPAIDYFRADAAIADPGQTIELEWASTGGVTATIWRVSRGGPLAEWWDVEPSGTMTYTIGALEREYVMFSLWVAGPEGNSSGAGLTIALTCPDTWFFEPAPDGCPGAPAVFVNGAEQAFEHGVMLWVDEGWAPDQAGIFVLYDDAISSPRWAFFPDTWEEGEPLCDVGEPPAGLLQPERGFGKVWCEEPGYEPTVRERLGWATATEVGYDTAVQRDSAPKYTTLYVRAADGNVYKLWPERSGWERIVVE